MESETPFRIALVLVIALTMAVVICYRRRAASSDEKISHQDEGIVFAVVLRLAGMFLWIVTLAYLISPSSVQWATFPVHSGIRWFGVVVAAFSTLLMSWTLGSLANNWTDTVVIRVQATLVTDGPYRWVRHPYYVSTALLMFSVTLLTANWMIGVASLPVLGLLVIRVPLEEQMLVERFGQQYQDYMIRTGRFFPRLWTDKPAKAT